MRKLILHTPIFLVLLFSSCRSVTYFQTPNNIRNITGTLYLTNGKSVDGKLVINTNNMFSSPVKVYVDGERKPMQFPLMDIAGYKVRNDYYALKEVRSGANFSRQYSFMKRLTQESSRIHLFENIEEVTNTSSNNTSTSRLENEYFMQLPSEGGDGVWSLSSNKFVPNFDEKMSQLVKDCPALANKIANKEEGYFYAQVTLFKEKRADVLMRIIDDYNKCK